MKVSPLAPIVVNNLRGGRNDTDSPMELPFNQATEYLNCDWKDTAFARKRGGSIAVSQTGGTAFSSGVENLQRHVPGGDETAAELWGIDGAATPIWKRLTGGVTWANVTVDDAISTQVPDVVGCALNGKRFFSYDSTVDRLHVYDPSLSSPRVRRVGFATPAAPSVANTGSGSYAATLRYYRVRWLQLSGTTIIRRSEPSAATSFTPSGSGTAARITQPTVPSEGETHWEIEVSTDGSTWYQVYALRDNGAGTNVSTVIGTTTLDDTGTVYNIAPISDPDGTYSRFPSTKFIFTDGNRLLGGNAWEASGADSGGKSSFIWFTPVLGSADKGDDERVPMQANQKNRVAFNEKDGGALIGGGGPVNGVPYAFKYRQVWKMRPTGDVNAPYLPRKIRDDIGCIRHHTIALGEDQFGDAALYFLSHRGPYRITASGDIQYLGRDNEVTWRSMNLAASISVGHSVYYPDLHQWWLWIATGASNTSDVKMVFDVNNGWPDVNGQIRGGWAKHTGLSAATRCSCLFSNTIAAAMSRDLKPYTGTTSGTVILKCDTTDTDDNGTDFQAYVTTRPLLTTKDLQHKVGLAESIVIGKALAGSDLQVTIARDFGLETRSHALSLAPTASETRVIKKIEGSEMGEADVIQLTLGDAAANDEVWTVDAVIAPVMPQEQR